jgi:hypothetical protein
MSRRESKFFDQLSNFKFLKKVTACRNYFYIITYLVDTAKPKTLIVVVVMMMMMMMMMMIIIIIIIIIYFKYISA